MDFDLMPEHEELLRVARRVADELKTGYIARDRAGRLSQEVVSVLAEADLIGLNIAAEAGGQGAGYLATGLVCEVLAGADILGAGIVLSHCTTGNLLHRYGDPSLAAHWIPRIIRGETTIALGLTEPQSGSDLRHLTTTAKRDGDDWVLRGEKSSVSYYDSEAVIVLAATDAGPELFWVDDLRNAEFFPLEDLGMRTGDRSVMILDDVRVPETNRLKAPSGIKAIFAGLTAARLLAGMNSAGIARAALDDVVEWSKSRVTFGKPLSERQGVAFPLVDAWTELEMARLLALRGLWLADEGRPHETEAAMVKSWLPQLATRICHEALVITGHVGYTLDHPIQLRLRDAIGLEIGEGPQNIQRIVLSRTLLGTTPG